MIGRTQRRISSWGWRRIGAGLGVIAVLAIVGIALLRYGLRPEPEVVGGAPTARLIGAEQYVNAVRDVFGTDIEVDATLTLPQRRQGLLSLGAVNVVVTPGLLRQFDRAARSVAAQVTDPQRRALLVPCTPQVAEAPDDACAARFFAHSGRFLFRRPLTESELQLHVTAAREATETFGDFYAGLTHSLAALLVAPQFLYFAETVEPDPERPGRLRLDGSSKATRLSLFLWNSLPDRPLLDAAETGRLHEQAEVRRQVQRMLGARERLEHMVRAFFDDFLLFDRFAAVNKDPVIYPAFTPVAAESAREQALRLVTEHLIAERADYRQLFTTNRIFVNEFLAPLHRVPITGVEWTPVTLDRNVSAGLLTTLGFLAVHSHPGRSSPTLRGKAMREALMCQKVPDPPPNVNFTSFEESIENVGTARERLSLHATDAACSGCHKITDPIGLALENFDGAGQFRTAEQGTPIDASGDLDGQPFNDVAGLGRALSEHPALPGCLTNRLYAHAIGRETNAADKQWLAYMTKRFAADGYRFADLLSAIATSRAFFAVGAPADSPAMEKIDADT